MGSTGPLEIERMIQALNFFLNKEPSKSMSKMKLLKLLWLTDRYTLRRYGYTLTNDKYYAMEWGSVGSATKEVLDNKRHSEYIDKYIRVVSEKDIKSAAPVDGDEFSELDVEALEKVWNSYGGMTPAQLSRYCHLFPEWVRHEEKVKKMKGSYPEDFDDFFENPDAQLSVNIFDQSEEILEVSKEAFEEDKKLGSVFS